MVKQQISEKKIKNKFLTAILVVMLLGIATHPAAAMEPYQAIGPTYIVQSGDTFNEIAIRFGLTAEDLLAANAIDNPNALFIGQSIRIPGFEGIEGVLTSAVIPLGTSLTGLARQYRLKQSDLATLNRLVSPSEMIAGASIIIPVREAQDQLFPVPALMPGVTMLETAIRSGTSPWTLMRNNQLKATWDLLQGDVLFTETALGSNHNVIPQFIDISMDRLPLIQGETLHVKVTTPLPVMLRGQFNHQTLQFFSENGEEYHGFHGIHALMEPGIYPLQINAESDHGIQLGFDQLVLLSPGYYGTQTVFVGTEFLDDGVIEEEDAYLLPLFTRSTPVRHWEGQFQFPVDEPCVNSPFGLRRIYNEGLLFFYHTGVDFAVCAQNLNIYAPAAGEVIFADELTIRGNAILIDHGWGVISGYWHMSEFNVSVGDFVQPGDLLGLIGNTGRSAGPHLHFELIVSGTPVNPQTWLDRTFP